MSQKIIHISDLYHPHADPDDHYDLAQIFALAKSGDFEIEEILVDHTERRDFGSPALCAVYQMNHLTKQNVHVTFGADTKKFCGRPEEWIKADKSNVYAAEEILRILSASDEKVYVNIVGGCLDTAIALERGREIFREKCAGIVLNAGSCESYPPVKEYNVSLGPIEYSKIFEAPCPVYWNPCVKCIRSYDMETWRAKNATYYRFMQRDLFEKVSDEVKNFFLYMLKKDQNSSFIRALYAEVDAEAFERFGKDYRGMWCTASIFDMAGKCVDIDGNIMNKEDCKDPVCGYRAIEVSCDREGENQWSFSDKDTMRYIFTIFDEEKYEKAMTKALIETLKTI